MDAERDDLSIVSLNVDDNQQTAAKYEVLSIPTMILFKDGEAAKRIVGAMPKSRIEAELEPALAA
jgi:thioredoxin 1